MTAEFQWYLLLYERSYLQFSMQIILSFPGVLSQETEKEISNKQACITSLISYADQVVGNLRLLLHILLLNFYLSYHSGCGNHISFFPHLLVYV
jgi:hypothetical protein